MCPTLLRDDFSTDVHGDWTSDEERREFLSRNDRATRRRKRVEQRVARLGGRDFLPLVGQTAQRDQKGTCREKCEAALLQAQAVMTTLSVEKAARRSLISRKCLERAAQRSSPMKLDRGTGNKPFDAMRSQLMSIAWPSLFTHRGGHFNLSAKDAEAFKMWNDIDPHVIDRFMHTASLYAQPPQLVFHGTPAIIHPSIKKHGLLVPTHDNFGVNVQIRNGNVNGPGIYTSELMSTGVSYASGGAIICCAAITADAKKVGPVRVIPYKEHIVPLATVKHDVNGSGVSAAQSSLIVQRYEAAARQCTVRQSERVFILKKYDWKNKAGKLKKKVVSKWRSRTRVHERRLKNERGMGINS